MRDIITTVTFELVLNIQGDVQRVERQHRVVDQTDNGFCCHLTKHRQKRLAMLDRYMSPYLDLHATPIKA